jgi:hypothetical protein
MVPRVVLVEAALIDVDNRDVPAIAAHDSRTEPVVCGQVPPATIIAMADVGAYVGNLEPWNILRAKEARVPDVKLVEVEDARMNLKLSDERVALLTPSARKH